MALATKRRKTQPQRYECQTCLVSRISSQFPDSNPTSTCEHMINTCKRCLKEWVESQIETNVFTPRIACPECDQKMERSDVEGAVAKKPFARYLKLEKTFMAENNPGWRWCLAPGCGAGQVHTSDKVNSENGDDGSPGHSKQIDSNDGELVIPGSWSQDGAEWITTSVSPEAIERMQTEQQQLLQQGEQRDQEQQQELQRNAAPPGPDIFECHKCGAKACVPCDRPWHENETCESYKESTNTKARIEEENASLAAIRRETKQCPSCSKNIFKIGGCSHMYCTQCLTEFCWECLHPINSGGQYCGCYDNQFQDHPLQAEYAGEMYRPLGLRVDAPGRDGWAPNPMLERRPYAPRPAAHPLIPRYGDPRAQDNQANQFQVGDPDEMDRRRPYAPRLAPLVPENVHPHAQDIQADQFEGGHPDEMARRRQYAPRPLGSGWVAPRAQGIQANRFQVEDPDVTARRRRHAVPTIPAYVPPRTQDNPGAGGGQI